MFTGGGDEAAIAARRPADLPHAQPALQPDGAAHDVRGGQHRHQPAGRDQDRRHRRRRLQVPVHRQGRRQRQQVVPVPGDQGAAQRGDAAAVDLREDADARHRGLPAVPPRRRDRRHVGRVRRRDGQAGLDALPRHAAHRRARRAGHGFRDVELESQGARAGPAAPASAPSSAASTSATTCASSACPATAPAARWRWPCRARPTARRWARSPGRRVPRAARDATRPASCPTSSRRAPRRHATVVHIDLNRPMAEILAELSQVPGARRG